MCIMCRFYPGYGVTFEKSFCTLTLIVQSEKMQYNDTILEANLKISIIILYKKMPVRFKLPSLRYLIMHECDSRNDYLLKSDHEGACSTGKAASASSH